MDRRYVGIDLHRRRSVIYAMDAEGDKLFCERIDNDALRLLEVVSAAGEDAEVVIEATYGGAATIAFERRECLSRDHTREQVTTRPRPPSPPGWSGPCRVLGLRLPLLIRGHTIPAMP